MRTRTVICEDNGEMMRHRTYASLLSAVLAMYFACLFCSDQARGEVYILVTDYAGDIKDNTTLKHYFDETFFPKRFAYIPLNGIGGHLFLPTPVNACSYIDPPPGGVPVNSTWIALVYDYPSCPSDMVMNVRNAGYRLIIASSRNDSHRTVSKEVSDSIFPIAIVREEYADYLKENVLNSTTESVFVIVQGSILLSIFVVTLSSFVCFLCFYCCCCACFFCCCCTRLCESDCGIQRHRQDITHWKRNFVKQRSATQRVRGMGNIAIDQLPIPSAEDFKEAALEAFKLQNQASALELLSHNRARDLMATCNQQYPKFGTFLLHNACTNGWFNVVRMLVENYSCCDPNIKIYQPSICSSTICAFLLKVLASIAGVVSNKYCNFIREWIYDMRVWVLHEGDLEECLSISDWTVIHCACKYGHLDIVKFLVEHGCDPACRNAIGATPLHFACWEGHLDVVTFLIERGCNPADSAVGLTPLHLACWRGHLDVVKFLLNIEEDLYSKCTNAAMPRHPPLHLACRTGKLDVVKLLVEQGIDLLSMGRKNYTPLHIACEEGHLGIVKFLLSVEKGFCMNAAVHKLPPLHLACRKGRLDVIVFLVEQGFDPVSRDSKNYTPLHIACEEGHLDIVKFLVNKKHCNHLEPTVKGSSVTPLHLANLHRHLRVSSFLTSPGVSRQAHYEYMSRLAFPPVFKVFVMGNHSVGKSTLVQAMRNRLTNTNWFGLFIDQFKRVSGVKPDTAGIIPLSIDSKRLGNITMYDLAGQREYYSSHAGVLEKAVAYPGSLLMVVVNLSENRDEIIQTLNFWHCFIENHCSQSGSKPDIVIVGSHADVVKSQLQKPKEKATEILNTVPSSLQVPREIIPINCTRLASDGLTELCAVIGNYCTLFLREVSTDINVNFLHALLCQEFKNITACRVSTILSHMHMLWKGWNAQTLSRYLVALSDESQFLYLRNAQNIRDSWVILDQEILLSEINGTVFAPENFKEHYDNISSSTGVVPFSKIREAFRKHNPEMIISFMSHLEFCHHIAESEALLISGGESRGIQRQSEKLFFFPALVSKDQPEESCKSIEKTHCKSGWSCKCVRSDQFLPLRFLHVLLLHLAFLFARPAEKDETCPVIQRQCNVWKSGIHWLNRDGVEAIVEVVEQNTAVILIMGCFEGREIACIKRRSEVIQTILELKDRFCGTVELRESFIHPDQLSYPLKSLRLLPSFTITELASAIAEKKDMVTSKQGHCLTMYGINELLYFEPYACLNPKLLAELFANENSDKEASNVFYQDAGNVAHTKMDLFKSALDINEREFDVAVNTAPHPYRDSVKHHCYLLFRTWAHWSPNPTYQVLRSALDKYSVFCGRNPLLLAGVIPSLQCGVGTASEVHTSEPTAKPSRKPVAQQDTTEDHSTAPHITDRPHLRELWCLQGRRGRVVKVVEAVAAEWEELAKTLHFDSSVIEHVKERFPQTEDACQEVLRRWLDGQEGTRQPVHWDTLIDSLLEAGFDSIANDLQEAVENYPVDVIVV